MPFVSPYNNLQVFAGQGTIGLELFEQALDLVEPGAITLPLCQALLTDTVLVSEAEIRAAMREIASSERWIIEGAAAVAVAAMKKRAAQYQGKRVAVVLCGRNITLDTFLAAVS